MEEDMKKAVVHRAEFIAELAWRTGLNLDEARIVTDAFLDILTDRFRSNQAVAFENFGVFEVKQTIARVGRNPRTNEEFPIPSVYKPVFRVSKGLKAEVTRCIQEGEVPEVQQRLLKEPVNGGNGKSGRPRKEVMPPRGYAGIPGDPEV